MKPARLILSALLSISTVAPAFSADDGGRPGAFLDYAASARSLGMGQAFTAIADDASAVYFNPSSIALMRRRNLAAQFSTLLEDSSIGFVGYAHPLERHAGLAVGVVTLGSGDITRRDASGNKTGSYTTSSNAAFLSGAFSPSQLLSLGTTAKVVRESVADDSAVGFGMDLSAMISASEKIRFGLMARNLVAPSLKLNNSSEEFPRSFTAGVAVKPAEPLTVGLDVEQVAGGSLKPRLGANYLINDILALRGGVNNSEFSLGLGLGIGDWGFDYALGYARASSDVRDLGSFHRFGLQFNFGLPVPRPAWGETTPRPQRAQSPRTVIVDTRKKVKTAKSKTTKTATGAAGASGSGTTVGASGTVPAAGAAAAKAKPSKPTPALDALHALGDRMDNWNGVPSPELQRQVDSVNRYLKKGDYMKPEDIYAAQGYVSYFLGEYANSARSLVKASDAAPADAALAKRAERARAQAQKSEKSTKISRKNETTEIRAVRERYESGDWNGTIVLAQRLLESSPGNAEARDYLRKAIDRLVQPRLHQAKELLDSDRFVESFILFQKVLDFEPDNAEALAYSNRVVKVIEKRSDMDSSSRGVSRSDGAVQQGMALFQKGLRLYAHGDVDSARNAWENALLQVRSQPLIYDTVRSTLVELGR